MNVQVYYDDELVGTVVTNQSLTTDETIRLAGIDICEMEDENTPMWDYELFKIEYV